MPLGVRSSCSLLHDINAPRTASCAFRKQHASRSYFNARSIGTSRRYDSTATTSPPIVPSNSNTFHVVPPSVAEQAAPQTTFSSFTSPPSIPPPLASLPLWPLLRGFFLTSLTSHPSLLSLSIRILRTIAYTTSPLVSPKSNPIMKFLLRHTIYAHFCAGETSFEVSRTVEALRKQGISGVMLGHGKELEVRAENFAKAGGSSTSASAAAVSNGGENATWEIDEWTKGNLETIGLTPPGAWVSIKMTGAGALTRHHLSKALPPPKEIEKAFASLVELATGKRVSLGIDAEQSHFQAGIDEWALSWAERYNRRGVPNTGGPNTNPSAQVNVDDGSYTCVYNTYQAYLKSASSRLIRDLRRARKEGFVLGVKLVRGAYLASEARHLPWSSKAETDTAYDGIAEALMRRQWIGPLKEGAREEARIVEKGFPEVSLCIATHNAASVRKALKLRQSQVEAGEKRIPMVYGQLYGMADYVTGELIGAAKAAERAAQEGARESNKGMMEVESPKVWKYLVWGTVDECAKYLVRRAEENRDAVSRTGEAREEYGRELWRRLRSVFIAGR